MFTGARKKISSVRLASRVLLASQALQAGQVPQAGQAGQVPQAGQAAQAYRAARDEQYLNSVRQFLRQLPAEHNDLETKISAQLGRQIEIIDYLDGLSTELHKIEHKHEEYCQRYIEFLAALKEADAVFSKETALILDQINLLHQKIKDIRCDDRLQMGDATVLVLNEILVLLENSASEFYELTGTIDAKLNRFLISESHAKTRTEILSRLSNQQSDLLTWMKDWMQNRYPEKEFPMAVAALKNTR